MPDSGVVENSTTVNVPIFPSYGHQQIKAIACNNDLSLHTNHCLNLLHSFNDDFIHPSVYPSFHSSVHYNLNYCQNVLSTFYEFKIASLLAKVGSFA